MTQFWDNRHDILQLVKRDHAVGGIGTAEIAQETGLSRATVQKHLDYLLRDEMVKRRKFANGYLYVMKL